MSQNPTIKKWLYDIACIIVGDLLLAAAVVVFWDPSHLVTGGVSGVGIIVADYTARVGREVPIWLTNLALNIPLFILGSKTMGRTFLIKTAFATFFLSVALYLMSFVPPLTGDILLGALFGGVASGLGLGLVFKVMATTGGTDLAASMLHRWVFHHYSIAKILFVIDSAIILSGFLAFGPVHAMYAVVAVFVSTKVTDTLLEGLSFSKAAFVISDQAEAIAKAVMERLERGVTALQGQGMFTLKEKKVLLCVVSAKELVKLKEIVRGMDERAFVIVADVREVVGEGFNG